MTQIPGFQLDISRILDFVASDRLEEKAPLIQGVARQFARREGPGAAALGWLDLPETVRGRTLDAVLDAAEEARADSEVLVVIGVGGAIPGIAAGLEALQDRCDGPEVVFAGTGLSSSVLRRRLACVGDRDARLCVVSGSGDTLEPAVAFRAFRDLMVRRYGREAAARRITVVTGAEPGVLEHLAEREGYRTFVMPADVGGRFSVLTPAGLLPLACAGLDVRALLAGARAMHAACDVPELHDNPAHLYAAARNALAVEGFTTEVLSSFQPDLAALQQWWVQLFGGSEGKEGRGIFPAACTFTADLDGLGQTLLDGRREFFETFLVVDEGAPEITVTAAPAEDPDDLARLAGRSLDDLNRRAYHAVRAAHHESGLPVITLELERLDEVALGGLFYFFQKAVAVSGRLLGVDPFAQPEVEGLEEELRRLP